MIAGFTGSRFGMTLEQRARLRALLAQLRVTELHHGDCKGADEEAADIAEELGLKTVAHPPENPVMRAWCESTEVREPLPYMVRNENIVKEAGVLIAAPASDKEVMRSGTWATVRRGRAAKKPVFVMQQNGNVPKGR